MRTTAHPYMANSVPAIKQELLDAVGVGRLEELFAQIPARPPAARGAASCRRRSRSEVELHRHLRRTLARNETCEANLSFLGGGCWQHHVPAICDEIVRRSEFVTPVWGTPSSDYGRNQAWFEFAACSASCSSSTSSACPVYSWGCAAGHAIRMASRLNGRREVLVPRSIDPERLAVIRTYCEPREMAQPHRRRRWSTSTRRPVGSTSTTCARS